jgi:putative flavoprotein involved in K+ transport
MSHVHDPSDTLDVVVIGAGQAGLALGYHLTRKRSRFVIVDGADALGQSWRSRWDSLRLFSSAQYDGVPGMRFPAAPDSYPTKDQVADYLTAYADRFHLPVLLGHQVTGLTREPATGFTVRTSQGPLRARQVVVATGAFQRPHVPDVAGRFAGEVLQVHSAHYRNPGQLPAGPVLVVGAGNSGLQIAEELAASNRAVHLAVGSKLAQVPQRFLGRDLFWWLTRTGAINKTSTSLLARRMRARGDLVIGTSVDRVARRGVTVHPRLVDAGAEGAVFGDGSSLAVSAVVWATGFRPDYPWLEVPGALDDAGRPVHTRGVSPVDGLYFLGLPWQHTRGSALLGFVRHDAAWIAEQIQAGSPAAVVPSTTAGW